MSLIDADFDQCQAHIAVDNEIGGPGVAASFIFVSWLTIIMASFLAAHELKLAVKRFFTWRGSRIHARLKVETRSSSPSDLAAPSTLTQAQNGTTTPTNNANNGGDEPTHTGPNTAELPPRIHKLIQVLGHICDMQVVTALAIIVAGLAQWTHISYYHEMLVTHYFQLTLDSFWAARVNYMDFYQIDHVHDNLTIPTHVAHADQGEGASGSSSAHNGNNNTPAAATPATSSTENTPNRTAPRRTVHVVKAGRSYYDDRQPRLQVRRAAVLLACILAVIWQFRLYFRENVGPHHWNTGPEGPCYRYLDRSNPIAILVIRTTGLIVFCLALGVTLIGYPWAGRVHAVYQFVRGWLMAWAWGLVMGSLARVDALRNKTFRGERKRMVANSGILVQGKEVSSGSEKQGHDTTTTTTTSTTQLTSSTTPKDDPTTHAKTGKLLLPLLKSIAQWTFAIIILTISSFILLVVFLACQGAAIWTYGDGFYPLLWFCYFCFNIWNTIAVISLLFLNRPLVDPEEFNWGFGQVLPMVLLIDIVFVTVDVFSRREPRPTPSRSTSNQSEERGDTGQLDSPLGPYTRLGGVTRSRSHA